MFGMHLQTGPRKRLISKGSYQESSMDSILPRWILSVSQRQAWDRAEFQKRFKFSELLRIVSWRLWCNLTCQNTSLATSESRIKIWTWKHSWQMLQVLRHTVKSRIWKNKKRANRCLREQRILKGTLAPWIFTIHPMKGLFHPIVNILRQDSQDKQLKKKIELCTGLEAVENTNKLLRRLRSTV